MDLPGFKGTKLVEIPYLKKQLADQSSDSNILIVGERIANGGITQTVMERDFNRIVCTDIGGLGEGSNLEKLMKENKKIDFVMGDFLELSFSYKFDYIVCISVLEHFGMNFNEHPSFEQMLEGDDYIRWNHDLRALQRMKELLSDTGKAIVTVPVGMPIMSGDIQENGMPMLRRYDIRRITMIEKMFGIDSIESSYYYSENFEEWFETEREITHPPYNGSFNVYSPNVIWAFTLS